MDEYDFDGFDGGGFVSLPLIPVNVYSFDRGGNYGDSHCQGHFHCTGLEEINPTMIESISHHEDEYSTFECIERPSTVLGVIPWTRREYLEYKHPVAFYKHRMASGRVVLTADPIIPTNDDDDVCQPVHTDNVTRMRPHDGRGKGGDES